MSQVLSSRLSIRDNGLVFSLLGSECSAAAAAVVQLYLATPSCDGRESEWQIHSCGVVCLVEDKKLHSTFIRLFSVKRARLIWEQEIYTPFTYSTPRPFFHTFHSDECWAGLNFCDEDEASRFNTAVQNCISATKAHPVLMRTYSLDSTVRRLLRNKLNVSLPLHRSPSSRVPPCESEASGTLTLAQRKGPLPAVPSNRDTDDCLLQEILLIPVPPSYPAPKLKTPQSQ